MSALTDRFRRFRSRFELNELLAAIVDASEDAIITTTLDGVVVTWNSGAEKVYGYTADEITDRPVSTLVPENRMHEVSYIFNRLRNGHAVERYETERVRKGGELIKVSLTWRPLRNRQQELIGASVIVRDLSSRDQAEAARRKAENEFKAIFENAAVGIALVDIAGNILRCNPVFQTMLGYSEAELRTLSIQQLTHPDDWPEEVALCGESLAGARQHFQMDKRYIRKDGQVIWVRLTASIARSEHGEPLFRVAIVEDITAQRRAEEHARESQQRLSLLLERSPLAVISWDAERRVTEWNPAAEKMFGHTRDEALGNHASFMVPENVREHIDAMMKDAMRSGGGMRSVNDNLTREGRVIRCEWYNESLVDASGNVVGIVSIAHDVTAQRDIEERLRQAQKMEAIGQLAGGIAHDFNNLLNVILGHAALMQHESRGRASATEHSTEIQKAAERAAALTRQLLAFSRKQVLQPEVLDLHEVVQGMSRMLERVIGEDIAIEIVGGDHRAFIRADRGQIEQVIMNLVVNARDAMPGGGRLRIETSAITLADDDAQRQSIGAGEYAVLSISDTGVGMDWTTQLHIFEPFFTTKEVGKGTGLGLSTVHGVVVQSGGNILVDSKRGVGTTFTIFLPRVAEVLPAAPTERADEKLLHGSETILLAEDEAALRMLMRQILESQGYTVLEAGDGREAIDISEEHQRPIQLLITDMVMPGMRGYELAQRMRKLRPSIRVLYISGYADTSITDEHLASGAISLLEKPFSPDALLTKIDDILQPLRLREAG